MAKRKAVRVRANQHTPHLFESCEKKSYGNTPIRRHTDITAALNFLHMSRLDNFYLNLYVADTQGQEIIPPNTEVHATKALEGFLVFLPSEETPYFVKHGADSFAPRPLTDDERANRYIRKKLVQRTVTSI